MPFSSRFSLQNSQLQLGNERTTDLDTYCVFTFAIRSTNWSKNIMDMFEGTPNTAVCHIPSSNAEIVKLRPFLLTWSNQNIEKCFVI
jgi:hypothetical protein